MLRLSSSPPPSRSGDHPAFSRRARWWLIAGLAGSLLLLALPGLTEAWRVNQAGLLLNRYEVTRDPVALTKSIAMMRPGDGDPGDVPYWRTFGAIAVHQPSEAAYDALERAGRGGGLDRLAELWLGEIASHTGHWERAEEAYSRFDATNVLVERGEEAIQEGDTATARHWYLAASSSIRAAIQRELASVGEPQLPGARAAPDEGIIASQSSRAVPLLRIGRGLLALDEVEQAVSILELAYSQMVADPPGTREQQAIRFSLAHALVVQAHGAGPPGVTPAGLSADLQARVDRLVADALAVDETGSAHQQAGDLLSLAGDPTRAAAHYYRAIDLDPRLGEAYLALGAIRGRSSFPTLALQTYADGHDALPSDPALATAWAVESYLTMPPELALPRLEEAAGTGSRDPYLFAYLGDAHLALGHTEDALRAYSEGLTRAPDADPLLSRLAKLVAEMEGWPVP